MCTCLEKPYNKKISSISLNSNKRNSEKTFVLLLQCIFNIYFIQSIALIESRGVHFLLSTTSRSSLDGQNTFEIFFRQSCFGTVIFFFFKMLSSTHWYLVLLLLRFIASYTEFNTFSFSWQSTVYVLYVTWLFYKSLILWGFQEEL